MRPGASAVCLTLVLIAWTADASAEPQWTYRARVSFEAQPTRVHTSTLFVAAADSSWERGRLRLAGGLIAVGASGTRLSLRTREAFARLSATSWMDVEAGQRLVRWGVGYGFAPTGALDPPRLATDPTDRFGRQDGLPLVSMNVFLNDTSLTLAAASPTLWRAGAPSGTPARLLAARVRTVLPHGVELALIGSAAAGRRAAVGANITHVVGQRLEWHLELLVHDRPVAQSRASRARSVSGVAGVQYTLQGVNVVMEYHRDMTTASPDGVGGRRVFLRAARAGADIRFAPELILIRAIDGGGWTTVAGLRWAMRRRVELYVRTVFQESSALSLGATVRF